MRGVRACAHAAGHPSPPCTRAGLAQNRFLEDPAFVAYLEYLQYWKQPAYAQYLMCAPPPAWSARTRRSPARARARMDARTHAHAACTRRYPHALFFLDLLQSPEFRKEVARSTVTVSA